MEKRRESPRSESRRSSSAAKLEELIGAHRELEAFDRLYRSRDADYHAGVDEAGRGALAGPVVAAAVVLPPSSGLLGVNDSKTLVQSDREVLYNRILERALSVGVAYSTPRRIDRDNILNATLYAMGRAIGKLEVVPGVVLVDGREGIHCPGRVIAVPGGDGKSIAIAAASIIAKVTRDRLMHRLHERYPMYNFTKNKGYGTREHLLAISKHGIISEHRKTFRFKGIEKNAEMF